MIDWDLTVKEFGYGIDIISTAKRPLVICKCDKCDKSRRIKIRIKSRIINNQMDWLCPACVKIRDSDQISKTMINVWANKDYRERQLKIKSDQNYIIKQSIAGKSRWLDVNYRSKIEKNIEPSAYIERSINSHGDIFDYTESDFKKWHNKIIVTCKKCARSSSKDPQKHLIHGYCSNCGVSKGQREICQYIEELGLQTQINNRTILNGLELDILVKAKSIAIEYHGLYWHSFNSKESKSDIYRHQTKALSCNASNIRLLQFFDFEWLKKNHIVKSMITQALGISTKLDARKMDITIIDNDLAQTFFDENHLYGHRPAKVTVALTLEGQIQAAMSFSKCATGLEVIRLAYKSGSTIRGGASRLLKYATSHISNHIITFADLRYSLGNVYDRLGFQKIKVTSPGYFYYKQNGNDYLILSRQQCQKHKLKDLLSVYNQDLSESQNMFNNQFRRVWNAGNILYELKLN